MPALRLVALACALAVLPAALGAQRPADHCRGLRPEVCPRGDCPAVHRRNAATQSTWCSGRRGRSRRQIIDGAPFEMFLSADEAFVEKLQRRGPHPRRRRPVRRRPNRPVRAARIRRWSSTSGSMACARLLASGGVRRFAIANPEHAPYGKAAEAALRAKGLWQQIQPALVLGENITQAAQFATTGNAVGGILAYSLALTPAFGRLGRYALHPGRASIRRCDSGWCCSSAPAPAAEQFYRYLQGDAARAHPASQRLRGATVAADGLDGTPGFAVARPRHHRGAAAVRHLARPPAGRP